MAGIAGGNNQVAVVDDNPMSGRQWIVVFLMVFLNALDGFDVLSSAFAAPGITKEWGIERAALGIVLSAELIGMGFGSVILGSVADKFGRKQALYLTDPGTGALAEAKAAIDEHEAWLKGRFSAEEIEKLVELLARIHE